MCTSLIRAFCHPSIHLRSDVRLSSRKYLIFSLYPYLCHLACHRGTLLRRRTRQAIWICQCPTSCLRGSGPRSVSGWATPPPRSRASGLSSIRPSTGSRPDAPALQIREPYLPWILPRSRRLLCYRWAGLGPGACHGRTSPRRVRHQLRWDNPFHFFLGSSCCCWALPGT